jgi:hypothetical protein
VDRSAQAGVAAKGSRAAPREGGASLPRRLVQ